MFKVSNHQSIMNRVLGTSPRIERKSQRNEAQSVFVHSLHKNMLNLCFTAFMKTKTKSIFCLILKKNSHLDLVANNILNGIFYLT